MTSREKLYRLQEALRLLLDLRKLDDYGSNYWLNGAISHIEELAVHVKLVMKGGK